MVRRVRALKHRPVGRLEKIEDYRELVKRLVNSKPRTTPEKRLFATLVDGLKRARPLTQEERKEIEEFVKMRMEVEEEERGKTQRRALSGETEEVERHVLEPRKRYRKERRF